MEKMYIKRGNPIIIGDTLTGNENEGHRFIGFSLKDAEHTYRNIYHLERKRFKKIFCDKYQFGYIF